MFAGCDAVTELGSIPSGLIAMWSGASDNIPIGWLLCDGNNNTPDLRNRFIVGAGSTYSVGNTGGSDSVTLTTAQIPSHTHTHSLTAASAGAHMHSYSGTTNISGSSSSDSLYIQGSAEVNSDGSGPRTVGHCAAEMDKPIGILWSKTFNLGGSSHTHSYSGNTGSAGVHTHSLSDSISSIGSDESHENRPPYYALCFIMKE